MKKKVLFKIIPLVFLCIVIVKTNIYSAGTMDTIFDYNNMPGKEDSIAIVDSSVRKIWGTVELILQVAAVAAFIFAGVRYMFASADAKADIKKSMLILVVGAVLVFGASFVVDLITTATGEITGQG